LWAPFYLVSGQAAQYGETDWRYHVEWLEAVIK